MSAIAIRVLLALALLAGSYWAGDHNRNNAWLAKQAEVERSAHAKYAAEVKRGDTASGNFLVEHQAMQSNFQKLTEKFNGLSNRVPLVVTAGADACVHRQPFNMQRHAAPGVDVPGVAAPNIGQTDSDGAVDLLTAGAVWMWNSALTGTDQPAGACGVADTSPAACAAATTATLDDAWANHRANAQTCAEDRLAHQRLIDFLNRRNAFKPESLTP